MHAAIDGDLLMGDHPKSKPERTAADLVPVELERQL